MITSTDETGLLPSKDRLLAARWPITALAPEDIVVNVDATGAASYRRRGKEDAS